MRLIKGVRERVLIELCEKYGKNCQREPSWATWPKLEEICSKYIAEKLRREGFVRIFRDKEANSKKEHRYIRPSVAGRAYCCLLIEIKVLEDNKHKGYHGKRRAANYKHDLR